MVEVELSAWQVQVWSPMFSEWETVEHSPTMAQAVDASGKYLSVGAPVRVRSRLTGLIEAQCARVRRRRTMNRRSESAKLRRGAGPARRAST